MKRDQIEKTTKAYQKMDIKNRNLTAIQTLCWDTMGDLSQFIRVKQTPEYLEYKVTQCYINDIATKMGTKESAYARFCSWDDGFCKGLNEKIRFTRTKSLTRGDAYCHHIYQLNVNEQ